MTKLQHTRSSLLCFRVLSMPLSHQLFQRIMIFMHASLYIGSNARKAKKRSRTVASMFSVGFRPSQCIISVFIYHKCRDRKSNLTQCTAHTLRWKCSSDNEKKLWWTKCFHALNGSSCCRVNDRSFFPVLKSKLIISILKP